MHPRLKALLRPPWRGAAHLRGWPEPVAPPPDFPPTWLFLFAAPFGGSTLLAQVLRSAPGAAMLERRGEGQWLVPGLCRQDRWNPDKTVRWRSVTCVWQARVRQLEELVGPVDVVIEKSPPNLVRAAELTRRFTPSQAVVFNREPYANCASTLHRMHDADALRPTKRHAVLREIAEGWVSRSTWLRRHAQTPGSVAFTYEDFCADPAGCVARVVEAVPALAGVDVTKPVRVKDYPAQGVVNQNPRQIARLTDDDVAVIRRAIADHADLLAFFGYAADPPG